MTKDLILKLIGLSKRLLNGFFFYLGWFVVVLAAAKDNPTFGVFITGILLGLHFLLFDQNRKDLVLLVVLSTAGFFLDSFYIWAGWLHYHSPNHWLPQFAPLWIVCLHAIFATSINHSLAWLKAFPPYAGVLGTFGIVTTYLAGARMGAIDFIAPYQWVLFYIGCIWFFYLPAVYWFSRWLDRKIGD